MDLRSASFGCVPLFDDSLIPCGSGFFDSVVQHNGIRNTVHAIIIDYSGCRKSSVVSVTKTIDNWTNDFLQLYFIMPVPCQSEIAGSRQNRLPLTSKEEAASEGHSPQPQFTSCFACWAALRPQSGDGNSTYARTPRCGHQTPFQLCDSLESAQRGVSLGMAKADFCPAFDISDPGLSPSNLGLYLSLMHKHPAQTRTMPWCSECIPPWADNRLACLLY